MIGILILTVILLVSYIIIIYWRKKVKEDFKLHHEELYPIAYVGKYDKTALIYEWGVSMKDNIFTDSGKGNNKVNINNYLGFIVRGCKSEDPLKNGNLIFVKKISSLKEDFTLPNLVILKHREHYLIRKAIRKTESGKLVVIDDLNGEENSNNREYKTKIVGIIEYDFNTK